MEMGGSMRTSRPHWSAFMAKFFSIWREQRRILTSKKLVGIRAMTLYNLGTDLSIIRVVLSAFRAKSKFETIMNKVSQPFDDVNKSAVLICCEGALLS